MSLLTLPPSLPGLCTCVPPVQEQADDAAEQWEVANERFKGALAQLEEERTRSAGMQVRGARLGTARALRRCHPSIQTGPGVLPVLPCTACHICNGTSATTTHLL